MSVTPKETVDMDRNCCAFQGQKCDSWRPKDNLMWVGEVSVGQNCKGSLLPTEASQRAIFAITLLMRLSRRNLQPSSSGEPATSVVVYDCKAMQDSG